MSSIKTELIERYGKIWNTDQATEEFMFHGFAAPFVSVTRRSDNVKGSLRFTHMPRYYYDFQKH